MQSVRLPREDESGRVRGSGYIEFADREGLIAAISVPDLEMRGRKIRIDVSTNEPDFKRGGNRGRYENFGASEHSRDWRGGPPRERSERSERSERGERGDNDGNWRSGDRPKTDSPPPARRNDRGGYNTRFTRDEPAAITEERPRIKLQPRTVPLGL